MAKKSLGKRQARRETLVARHADQRAELKRTIAHPDTDPPVRADAVRRLARMPRHSSPVRLRSRDQIDGRPRGVLARFGLSRVRFRELALRGELPGIQQGLLVTAVGRPSRQGGPGRSGRSPSGRRPDGWVPNGAQWARRGRSAPRAATP
ncbi:30S ribosomal protein S14 [Micromonospora sp. U21]|nr:30S ribosomal protein S14 [Micromonospora sp. U21]